MLNNLQFAMHNLAHAHRQRGRLRRSNSPEDERAMVVAVTLTAELNQVIRLSNRSSVDAVP